MLARFYLFANTCRELRRQLSDDPWSPGQWDACRLARRPTRGPNFSDRIPTAFPRRNAKSCFSLDLVPTRDRGTPQHELDTVRGDIILLPSAKVRCQNRGRETKRRGAPTVATIEQGLDRFETHRPGQRVSKLTPELPVRILAVTRRKPRDGSTHWSCRKLAAELGVSKTMVHKVWQEAGLKPHRLERYMASNDPGLERKATDIIGLYSDPPRHAAVFSVDEKTATQALDRHDAPPYPSAPHSQSALFIPRLRAFSETAPIAVPPVTSGLRSCQGMPSALKVLA